MKYFSFLIVFVFLFQISAFAGDDGERKRKSKEVVTSPAPKPKKDDSGMKSIEEVTKKCHKLEGLFNIYQDSTNGTTYLEVSEDQIGQEIIYFKSIANGVADSRNFKGNYRDNKIFKFAKYYENLELEEQNTKFYFDPTNALSNASNSNINNPIIYSSKIVGMSTDTTEEKTKRYLIESNNMFLTETINQMTPTPASGPAASKMFNVGKLSKSKTKYKSIRNYPSNTDVVVEYIFENPVPRVSGTEAGTNPRYTSVTVQHSFVAVPDNDYIPRYEDSRVGYFYDRCTDLTSASATPYRDVINRWYLTKKDPNAAISEPVEPIVWWMENTTPEEIRPLVKKAALEWNSSFEKAGFKNALVIKEQPDDAEWDAGDIRYNVLRWTSSPNPPFGGYGPSFSNPRTGQILGADIMLEYIYITGRLRQEKVFNLAGLSWAVEESHEAMDAEGDPHFCSAGHHAHMENLFAMYALNTMNASEDMKTALLEQSVSRLVLHELGHTLGLAHNFCASTTYSPAELNQPGTGEAVSASVMDYHATNIAHSGNPQYNFTNDKPGLYDDWAIEFGYREFANESESEKGLAEILAKAAKDPKLCFGNDADDMRAPGRGLDPRMNISDLSSDPIEFSIGRIELVKQTMPELKKNILEDGSTYHEFRNSYLMLTGNYGGALNVVSKQIGGVHVNRDRVGESNSKPFTPVAYKDQKRAMNTLSKYAFSPQAFQFDNELISYLKMQRRGWDFYSTREEPEVHSRVATMQNRVLDNILHPRVLARMTDSELYGNKYSVNEMLSDLTDAIYSADIKNIVNSYRQNLQLEYVKRLGKVLQSSSYDYVSQSAALAELTKVKSMASTSSNDAASNAHRKHLVYAIDNILDKD